MRLTLRWRAWHGDESLELEFPPPFEVVVYPPKDGADIGAEGIRQAFANPIGGPRIAELSRGKRSAVIVVDATAGIEVGTERAWQILEEAQAPCLFFINTLKYPSFHAETVR